MQVLLKLHNRTNDSIVNRMHELKDKVSALAIQHNIKVGKE